MIVRIEGKLVFDLIDFVHHSPFRIICLDVELALGMRQLHNGALFRILIQHFYAGGPLSGALLVIHLHLHIIDSFGKVRVEVFEPLEAPLVPRLTPILGALCIILKLVCSLGALRAVQVDVLNCGHIRLIKQYLAARLSPHLLF